MTVDLRQRFEELEAAIADETPDLRTERSPESARPNSSSLAKVPFLRIGDIVALRSQGIRSLEELETSILDVPEQVWPRVLNLARANVLELDLQELESAVNAATAGGADGTTRCLALTAQGRQCRNPAREGSKYCSVHAGYQPTEEELEARREGRIEAT